MTKRWKWSFDNDWNVEAWYDVDDKEGPVVKVQWLKNGKSVSEPFFIYLDDGPEMLQSLVSFVETMRRSHPPKAAGQGQ
jgi:hypothetical protein